MPALVWMQAMTWSYGHIIYALTRKCRYLFIFLICSGLKLHPMVIINKLTSYTK